MSNIKQPISFVSDCIDTRTSRNVGKFAAQRLALLKGCEGDRIQDSPKLRFAIQSRLSA
ncbi:hypothetical protein [uncultured Nostoc sp.]|uniref:hypothetical protein n=1 Tax=uncultured Nostoc sp. TaxID=340711 RepID=UPI0035C9772B